MPKANHVQNEAQVSALLSSTEALNSQEIQIYQVVEEIEKCIKILEEDLERLPLDNKEIYADFLAQSYYQTSHTPRLEALAISRCSANSNFFPLFLEGFQGEIGHESLALQDLKSLGYSIESFPELPATSSFYHSLYYFMNYESSLSILGYKLPLEGSACQDSQKLLYEKMLDLYGESSTSFLKVHDSEDVSHYKQGLEMLQMCESKDLIAICKACQHLSYASVAITEAILKKHLNK
jgi:hypothetical protein